MSFKTKIRKITAVLLCAALLFTAISVPSYADQEKNYTADCPYIKVLGLMSTDIHVDKDDPASDTVWPPQAGLVIKDVLKLLPSLFSLAVTKNYSRVGEKLYADVKKFIDSGKRPPVPELPFSFVYGGKSSREFLDDWAYSVRSEKNGRVRIRTWRVRICACHARIFLWRIRSCTWRIQRCAWRIQHLPLSYLLSVQHPTTLPA